MDNSIVLMSLTRSELSDIIRAVVREENAKKLEKDLMNFEETREYLGISTSTLNKWKSTNKIPFKKLGKRIFFNRKDVFQALKDSNYSKLMELQ